MAAFDRSLIPSRKQHAAHQLIKRENFASKNPGVILVFCIVFVISLGLIILFVYRRMLARRASRPVT